MMREKLVSFVMGSMIALAFVAAKARAADPGDYGDMNYAQAPEPSVQEIPNSLTVSEASSAPPANLSDIPEIRDDYRPEQNDRDANLKFASNPDSKDTKAVGTSTARDTFGVETLDNSSRIYAAPFLGFGSVMGNETADASPRYAIGGSLGYLVSDRMLVEGSYTYNEQTFSGSKMMSSGGMFAGNTDMFMLKNNIFRIGGRFFILGRDSQWRPYVGGGLSWSKGFFNYTDAYMYTFGNSYQHMNQMTIDQFGGYGELGVEYAIAPKFVLAGSFKIAGAISGGTSGLEQTTVAQYDPQKLSVGNSLARTASYQMGISLGMYF